MPNFELDDRYTAAAKTSADADFGDAENVAQATIVERADNCVAALNELVVATLDKATHNTKKALRTTVSTIYGAVCEFDRTKSGAQFLADRRVKAHGNTANPYQPYLRAFTRGTHSVVRGAVCKYSQVIALARHQNVDAENFDSWFAAHPIEKACAEFRRLTRKLRESQRDDLIRRVLVDPKTAPDKAPLLGATPITPGFTGWKLAVLDFASDGSGDFRLLGVLSHDKDAVMRIVLADAAKATP